MSTLQNASGGGGGKNSDEVIFMLADSILHDIPEPFHIKDAERKYPVSYE